MRKNILLFLVITLSHLAPSAFANSCSVNLKNTEIINSEFYINFTTVVENIFIKHGYIIDANNADFLFEAKNFITTGTNYFKLKQVNIEFSFSSKKTEILIHEIKNCFTVSCTADKYLKALKGALKKFDQNLKNCLN